jgi:hypothetical protein
MAGKMTYRGIHMTKITLREMAVALQNTDWYKDLSGNDRHLRRLIDIAATGRQVISRFGARAIQRVYEAHCTGRKNDDPGKSRKDKTNRVV